MGWLCESLGCLVRWGGGAGPQQLCCCLIYIFELSEVLFEIGSYGPPYFEIYNFTMTLSCLPPVWGLYLDGTGRNALASILWEKTAQRPDLIWG